MNIGATVQFSAVIADAPREMQTINMIVSCKTNAEIASIMRISPKTAEKHCSSLMGKIGVRSAVELMSCALRDGLIERQDHR